MCSYVFASLACASAPTPLPTEEYAESTKREKQEVTTFKAELEAWRASSGVAAKRKDKQLSCPKVLNLKSASGMLPQVAGVHIFESATEQRCRCFYPVQGSRSSTSASFALWGHEKALKWCVQWAWATHETHTGQACPYRNFMADFEHRQ
eukprot:8544155-Lingulodinium_polyedra.AAC.1